MHFLRSAGCGIIAGLILGAAGTVDASKLTDVSVIDQEIIMLRFLDGEVTFRDDGRGDNAYVNRAHETGMDTVKRYGTPFDAGSASETARWTITSADDSQYGTEGKHPQNCYRKSKLNGMSEQEWQSSDFNYEYTLEHCMYLLLPKPLTQGKTYSVSIDGELGSDRTEAELVWDMFTTRSEAIHINTVGFSPSSPVKAVDLYFWAGDGGARDYTDFAGKDVYVVNTQTHEKTRAGAVALWKKSAQEAQWYNLTGSTVWNGDVSSFETPGTYRIAIDGIGCSADFSIAPDIWFEPYRVSVLGFFYMRIGQDSTGGIRPVPRRPLWIPGKDPVSTKVYLTTMDPFHSEWASFSSGDVWDRPEDWKRFRKSGNPTNSNAWGGHSDALDWDRHLGHVPIIYDMLLPFILTKGKPADDNLGIAESGNGIPDLLDEARYEVDFWLRLRDGKAYSHGLTNPGDDDAFYQAAGTAISAWANAFNAAMLGDCFRLAGDMPHAQEYRDSALSAYHYAESLDDQMLSAAFGGGECTLRGKDFKMSAAAYLYNLTGDTVFESVVNTLSDAETATSPVEVMEKSNQLWGIAGYLFTPQTVHYPELAVRMKSSVIAEAKEKEADYSLSRPSRRATDNETGYFQTIQNVQRTLVAHAVSSNESERDAFLRALILEADWGLGRNPLNMIQMTTASTPLAVKRSVENMYTTGANDGTAGMHPGHTPYLNVDDWDNNMVMGKPSWMTSKCYPKDFSKWPKAEAYFNTRYVWAHSEFTPQQTMRGKTALYAYLYSLGDVHGQPVRFFRDSNRRNGGSVVTAGCSLSGAVLCFSGFSPDVVKVFDISGRLVWEYKGGTATRFVLSNALVSNNRVLFVEGRNGTAVIHRKTLVVQ